jgi:hypothetical protein
MMIPHAPTQINGKCFQTTIKMLWSEYVKHQKSLVQPNSNVPWITDKMHKLRTQIAKKSKEYQNILDHIKKQFGDSPTTTFDAMKTPSSTTDAPNGNLQPRTFCVGKDGITYSHRKSIRGSIPLRSIRGFTVEEKTINTSTVKYIRVVDSTGRRWEIFPNDSTKYATLTLIKAYFTILYKLHIL